MNPVAMTTSGWMSYRTYTYRALIIRDTCAPIRPTEGGFERVKTVSGFNLRAKARALFHALNINLT